MKFWKVLATVLPTEEKISFIVQSPDIYSASKIKDTLIEVHPEYKSVRVKETERPSWMEFSYGEADKKPPRPKPSEAQEAPQEEA